MKAIYASLVVLLFWMGTAAAQEQGDTWRKYTNDRLGFSLVIPSRVFAVEKQSEAGDGLVFVSKDGETRLLVGALKNADARTPSSYQDYIAQQSYANYDITYRRGGDSWFVLSGEGNGKTFYEKVMFSCSGGLISSFAIIYPTEQRKAFNPIVERIEDSFRPGTQCGSQPAAKTERPAAKTTARRVAPKAAAARPPRRSVARASGPRSALADRIARDRGTDVIVILRRTGPPYDRKIVRGYVSR
jgi:pyruvate/2-oxoglutarate dehydrogenase complex dihydrolipoamide acyltransferase (E2) component